MFTRLLISISFCLATASAELLIRDVTVVDVATGAVHPNRSILIRGDRIIAIGAGIETSKTAQVVNGTGRYVMPGLWDMHVHLTRRNHLPAYLSHGVTGVRDMGSDLDHTKDWRRQIEHGEIAGPHVETCGPPFDGFPSTNLDLPVTMVRGPVDARSSYDNLDDKNVDFIGILPRLPRDAYFALTERARKYYSPVAGAVPATVSLLEAVDNRQRSIDQMSGVLLACSTEEKKLRGPRALALERRDWAEFRDLEAKALETFSAEKADALFRRMAMFETRAVPVLVKLRSSPGTRNQYEKLAELVLAMKRAGVEIMAGADDAQVQDELELLVAAGFTPAEALRSATVAPARYLDASESLGTVEQGKIADLVLLDANPLSDIRNTRKISAVIVGGKYLNRPRLQALTTHR